MILQFSEFAPLGVPLHILIELNRNTVGLQRLQQKQRVWHCHRRCIRALGIGHKSLHGGFGSIPTDDTGTSFWQGENPQANNVVMIVV